MVGFCNWIQFHNAAIVISAAGQVNLFHVPGLVFKLNKLVSSFSDNFSDFFIGTAIESLKVCK